MLAVLVIEVSTIQTDDLFSKKDHEIRGGFNDPETNL